MPGAPTRGFPKVHADRTGTCKLAAPGAQQARLTYTSLAYGVRRNLYVYVPPQHESDLATRFPVLCLRHGNGDDESAWPVQGRAGVILDNLIAERKALPMLIVMPYGESGPTGGESSEGMVKLDAELRNDIMPPGPRCGRVEFSTDLHILTPSIRNRLWSALRDNRYVLRPVIGGSSTPSSTPL